MSDSDESVLCESAPDDLNSLATIYRDAFPEEDLFPLVKELLQDASGVLSLVTTVGAAVAGNVIFTPCRVAGHTEKVALLGPLVVAPNRQRRGIGTTLVRAGLERLEQAGVSRVFVLGDPGYYGRIGFSSETGVTPPYQLPGEWRTAWQSIYLRETDLEGVLEVPAPWRRSDLWSP